jgi:hypothetical protein
VLPDKFNHVNPDVFNKLNSVYTQWASPAEWLIDAWAWVYFTVNTSLTFSIMYRIMCVSSRLCSASTIRVLVANHY